MSNDASDAGFGKFVPGFDFLQSLAKGAAQSVPQMPSLGGWVAPTLSVDDLEKRISELKAVQFWLDQNAMALKATIQALEVQKMTLATLKGMNVSMAEVAKAFSVPTGPAAAAPPPPAARPAPEPVPEPAAEPAEADGAKADAARAGVVDAMQWWGALTQQFQQIAATAMQEAAARAAPEPAAAPAPTRQRAQARTSAAPARQAAKTAAKKAAPRKRAG